MYINIQGYDIIDNGVKVLDVMLNNKIIQGNLI